ncbi:glycosyltransferase [Patescibacteria group bacterium]|nr:glycosyltransferase [Patescibacteria group bacterium]MBU1256089.1 glycosyltransferase [Patescibacteria group bacterium]MBU1457692.1 glycosyltransferase [Patescibacteria group bacterium]
MFYLILAVSTIVFVRGITTLFFLLRSLSWLKAANTESLKSIIEDKPQVHILIPALREQKRIIDTIKYFQKHILIEDNVDLIIVTTQREFEKKFSGLSTNQLVKNFIAENNCSNISIIDSPHQTGIKAHQLNYALDQIDDDSFITVYDADSRPHPRTFEAFYSELAKNPKAKVFQQSAVFFNNFKSLKSSFLRSSAILQSRWTLAHELPRLFRQSFGEGKFIKKYAYAHVVGHGLFIDINVLKSVGGFPAQTITEDLFLGYLLRASGHSIYPLPLLESSDAPTTVKSLWGQKYVWFFGPLKMITYLKYVLKNTRKLKVFDLSVPWIMTVQGMISATAWLVSGPFIFLLLASPLLTQNITMVLFAWLAVFTYGPLQFFITLIYYQKLLAYAGTVSPNPK